MSHLQMICLLKMVVSSLKTVKLSSTAVHHHNIITIIYLVILIIQPLIAIDHQSLATIHNH